MSIYVILIVIYALLAILENKYIFKIVHNEKINKILRLIILLFPIFFTVAFRAETVGNDTTMYKYLYEKYAGLSYISAIHSTSKEVGFTTLCYIMSKIGFDYFQFQIIIAAITYLAFGRFLYKHSNNYSMSILVFMCILGYFRSMNISREIMTAMLALNIIDYLIEGKKLKYILGILFLSLFHKTALVLLILLLYDYIKLLGGFKKVFAIFIVIIAYISVDKLLSWIVNIIGKYDYLIDSKYMNENGIMAMLALVIFTLLFYYLQAHHIEKGNNTNEQKEKVSKKEVSRRSNIILFAYYICLIWGVIGFKFGLADRVVIYFSMLFTETITYKLTKSSKIFKPILLGSLIIYYVLVMITRNNWHGTIPYLLYF